MGLGDHSSAPWEKVPGNGISMRLQEKGGTGVWSIRLRQVYSSFQIFLYQWYVPDKGAVYRKIRKLLVITFFVNACSVRSRLNILLDAGVCKIVKPAGKHVASSLYSPPLWKCIDIASAQRRPRFLLYLGKGVDVARVP